MCDLLECAYQLCEYVKRARLQESNRFRYWERRQQKRIVNILTFPYTHPHVHSHGDTKSIRANDSSVVGTIICICQTNCSSTYINMCVYFLDIEREKTHVLPLIHIIDFAYDPVLPSTNNPCSSANLHCIQL